MLRISKLADYATLIMVCFARKPTSLMSAKMIAELSHLQLPTVGKLLKQLSSAGLLTSTRGPKGGYQLARPIEQISLKEIIEVLEGSEGVTECSDKHSACSIEAFCITRHNWQLVTRTIQDTLAKISLAEFARPPQGARHHA